MSVPAGSSRAEEKASSLMYIGGVPNEQGISKVMAKKAEKKRLRPPTAYLTSSLSRTRSSRSQTRGVNAGGSAASVAASGSVHIVGDCPVCQQANLRRKYTAAGIACAVFLPLIGLLCCFMLSERRCPRCGFTET